MKKIILISSAALLLFSCGANTENNTLQSIDDKANSTTDVAFDDAAQQIFLQKGDSIANLAQSVLMKNVAGAIKAKGVAGAVEFCNLNASPLTDSLSAVSVSKIQRLSDKNRNPNNAISNDADQKAWNVLKEKLQDTSVKAKHYVAKEGVDVYYYKPIMIGMPTCLQCHGDKNSMDKDALAIINDKYPQDKATGYKEKELRGMWKIKLN